MAADMDKTLLAIINDFAAWKGNPFTLAALLIARQNEIIREKLIAEGYPEAAEHI
jgi:hypothetical protein